MVGPGPGPPVGLVTRFRQVLGLGPGNKGQLAVLFYSSSCPVDILAAVGATVGLAVAWVLQVMRGRIKQDTVTIMAEREQTVTMREGFEDARARGR